MAGERGLNRGELRRGAGMLWALPALVLFALVPTACEDERSATGEPVVAADARAEPPPVADVGTRDAFVPQADDSGDPCRDATDCRSGFCITIGPDERVCSRRCGNDADCPESWTCRQVTNAESDVTFICVPPEAECAGADRLTDPNHCGACGLVCGAPGSSPLCREGVCALGPCLAGFHDLDGDPDNGCEYACTETRGGVEVCDEIDNDCDGAVDEGFDLSTDLAHCGACGAACQPANAEGACRDGVCEIVACRAGFFDLDGERENGCEVGCVPSNEGVEICDGRDNDCDGKPDEGFDLQGDSQNCGRCGAACDRRNAETACVDGVCAVTGCAPGFHDLDGEAENGCEYACEAAADGVERCNGRDDDCDGQADEGFELEEDPQHCGRCGDGCARPAALTACAAGRCVLLACEPGFHNLDGALDNGCEYACEPGSGGEEACNGRDDDCDGRVDEDYDLTSDPLNCGQCGAPCSVPNAEPLCVARVCRMGPCVAGFHDLDRDPLNGCEYACAPAVDGVERCNARDDDCDGRVDEDFDLRNDPLHCGECGRVCEVPRAVAACVAGACRVGECMPGFFDLDRDPDNGCEYACEPDPGGVEICNEKDDDCDGRIDEDFDLRGDAANCGACGRACAFDNAEALCAASLCRLGDCEPGFVNLDGDAESGCECALQNGGVEICNGEDDDCDGRIDEGFDFANNPRHCGGCGNNCTRPNADTVCRLGGCALVACAENYRDVDGDLANGCEVDCRVQPELCGPLFDYPGLYGLAPVPAYSCTDSIFGDVVFSMNVATLEFAVGGGALVVSGAATPLRQAPAPDDGTFHATRTIPGGAFGCDEIFELVGEFTDRDTWAGTFSIRFQGPACGFTNCANQSYAVTGTRR